MKIGYWLKSTLLVTAFATIVAVGCSQSDGGDTTKADTVGPSFASYEVSISENTVYVPLTVTDASLPISFEITGGDDMSKFQFDGDNRLKFIVAPDFDIAGDSNGDNQYVVKVKATDAVGNSREPNITVTVVDTVAPGFISPPTVAVFENMTIVTTVEVQGEDPVGSVTLAITGGEDQALFDLNGTSGLLKFLTPPDYEAFGDADHNNIYEVELTATEGVETVTRNMTITVNDLESGPLQIASAVYDDKGTGSTADDSLFVYFDRQIDDSSWADPAFGLTGGAAVAGATFEYTPDLPYKLTVNGGLSGFVPNTTTINVVQGGFTVDGEDVNASTPVTVTAKQVFVAPADRDFTVDEGAGIISDNDLGVTWEEVPSSAMPWSDAVAHCEALGGGWRLPSINELLNIANRDAYEPAIFDEFNKTTAFYFWSSTSYAHDDTAAWALDTHDGEATRYNLKTVPLNVRCISGELQSEAIFIRSSDATVYDTKSGLIWDDSLAQQEDENLTWQEAMDYCAGTVLGGYTTWRVPTVDELQNLVQYDSYKPSMSEVFENYVTAGYWTSTEDAEPSTNMAWTVRFSGGEIQLEDKNSPIHPQSVRCVTDG